MGIVQKVTVFDIRPYQVFWKQPNFFFIPLFSQVMQDTTIELIRAVLNFLLVVFTLIVIHLLRRYLRTTATSPRTSADNTPADNGITAIIQETTAQLISTLQDNQRVWLSQEDRCRVTKEEKQPSRPATAPPIVIQNSSSPVTDYENNFSNGTDIIEFPIKK